MPIKTGSVLERLCADVDKFQKRVARMEARIEALREEYKTAHWSKQRQIAGKGFRAKQALERAKADLILAEHDLRVEETRLLQPDTFLKFG